MSGRVATDPRFSRRRQAVERSKRRRLMVSSGAIAIVAAGLWGAFGSPLLKIDEVKVKGAHHTEVEDVIGATQLDAGDNLLLVSTSDIEASVARLPWVREVEVDRRLPGTVQVRIAERKPAMLLSVGSATWTIDRAGHVLVAGEAKEELPVLGGVQMAAVEPGVLIDGPEVTSALKAWRVLPGRLRGEIAGVFAPTTERLTFSLRDGTLVRYGSADKLAAKNEVLGVLLKRLAAQGKQASYIDVRVPTNAAVALRDTAPVTAPVVDPSA